MLEGNISLLREGIEKIFGSYDSLGFFNEKSGELFFSSLKTLSEQILLFNPVYKLVSATEEELITKHILDSLAPAGLILERILKKTKTHESRGLEVGEKIRNRQGAECEIKGEIIAREQANVCVQGSSNGVVTLKYADLGSGAGLPGLVLSAVFVLISRGNGCAGFEADAQEPDCTLRVTEKTDFECFLVERMGRRAGFLRSAIPRMQLSGRVKVLEKDISHLNEPFDIITFRAFHRLKDVEKDLIRITKSGSVIYDYKASLPDAEKDVCSLSADFKEKFDTEIISYNAPFLAEERRLIALCRK